MALLEINEVTKSFGGFNALYRVSFAVEERRIHAVIGPNGAGKTTLFNCVTGMLDNEGGTIKFEGHVLNGMKPHKRTELGIGRTFQNIRLFGSMTVLENVMLGRHCRTNAGILKSFLRPPFCELAEERATREAALELLEFMELAEKLHLRASALPYGQQRRLEIARALATKPKLLLLDEPAAGMNQNEIIDLDRHIKEVCDRGITVVLIEHHMSLVMEISDIVTVLNFGEKIAEGKPSEIRENRQVIEAYLGEEE
ncbi:MAG: ABC transporter ATP-binding protein [Candidatus Tectomicrobia bacterium]|nr:ABC transporter ATP-binding protein [Candidatus Tectomicrobia bacterium]